MRRYREALEGSVQTHFLGDLINCMSCANEMIYSALNSNIIRSFTDFWPTRPESHGLHLYANAQNSMWIGEFLHPDWDMFQSDSPGRRVPCRRARHRRLPDLCLGQTGQP